VRVLARGAGRWQGNLGQGNSPNRHGASRGGFLSRRRILCIVRSVNRTELHRATASQELSLHDQKFSLGKQKSCPRTKNLGPRTRILGQRSRILLIQPTKLVSETKILLPVTRNLVQRAEFSVREALRVHRRPGIVVRVPEKWLLEQDFCSCNQKNSSAIAEFSYKTI
jgi:hypothetical protein